MDPKDDESRVSAYKAMIGPFQVGANVSYYINATDTPGNFACSLANAPYGYYSIRIHPHSVPPTVDLGAIVVIGGLAAVAVMVVAVFLIRRGKKRNR